MAMIAAGGTFFTSFAYGLISGGIMDIYNSIISFMSGVPIDLDAYMQSLGMRLAINIAVSCISYAADALSKAMEWKGLMRVTEWEGLGGLKEQYGTMANFMGTQVVYNLALIGIGTIIQNAGKNYLKKNMGDIEREICAAIDNLLYLKSKALVSLFASDAAEKGKRFERLLVRAFEISKNYHTTYGGVKAAIRDSIIPKVVNSVGILPGLGTAAVIAAGQAYEGYLRYQELIPDFIDLFNEAVDTESSGALTPTDIMMLKLRETYGESEESELHKYLLDMKFFDSSDANYNFYQNCEKLVTFEFENFENRKEAVFQSCLYVSEKMSPDFSSEKQMLLAEKLKYIVLGNAKSMIRSEIIHPMGSFATGAFADYATDTIKDVAALDDITKRKQMAQDVYKKYNADRNYETGSNSQKDKNG